MRQDRAMDRAKRDAKASKSNTVVLHFAPYGDEDYGAALVETWQRVQWPGAREVSRILSHTGEPSVVEGVGRMSPRRGRLTGGL